MEDNNFSVDGFIKVFIISVAQVVLNKIFKIPDLPNEILAAFGFWDYFKLVFPVSFVIGMIFLFLFSKKIRKEILGDNPSESTLTILVVVFAALLVGATYLTSWLFPEKYLLNNGIIDLLPSSSDTNHHISPIREGQQMAFIIVIKTIYNHYKIVGLFNFILTIVLAIMIANYSHDKITKWMDK
jgi:hypothetical protein